MKHLKQYIQEGILDDLEDILDRGTETIENDIIKQFIEDNYRIKGEIEIIKKRNKYIVNVNGYYVWVQVTNKNINSLTNGLFEWGNINGLFSCRECSQLTSLIGSPKYILGKFCRFFIERYFLYDCCA